MISFLKATVISTLLLASALSQAASSTLAAKDVPLLPERDFAEAARRGHCIILFFNPDLRDQKKDEEMKEAFGVTPHQQADLLMRHMTGFKEQIASSVKFYRVDWKDYSPAAIERIRADTGSPGRFPESPTIVTYDVDGGAAHTAGGHARPDALPWFIHEIMGYYIHSVRMEKGEYLRGGWMITDTSSVFINLVSERKDSIEFNGRTENVQIINYASRRYGGAACRYERIYSRDGRMLGSIETYGNEGTFGYFDYDGTGKFQYRVTYRTRAGQHER